MNPVQSSHADYLDSARMVVNWLAHGSLNRRRRRQPLEMVRAMVMDVRNALYRSTGDGWVIAQAWLVQALDVVVHRRRPIDDLDLGALEACLTEAVCVLR